MRILITGNMGYVGPNVSNYLRKSRPEATLEGLDLSFFAHCLTTPNGLPERNMDVQHFKDVRTIEVDDLRGVDAIVHLAAISNDPMGKAYQAVTEEINQRASVALAKTAREAGVKRFVFASSCSVYGFAEGGPRDENSQLNPLTAYAKSKIGTELDVQDLATDDFVITCLRFPTACGMSDRLRLDLVLNDFVASAVATNKIDILSDGQPWRPLIDVKDMARGIDWAIGRSLDQGGPFIAINVGRNEWNYQVKDLAAAVKQHMPHIEVCINTDAQPDKRSYQVDFGLYAQLAPDHLPQVDLAQSIAELSAGLELISFSDATFRDSGFIRLKVLTGLRERGLLDESLQWT